MKNLLFVLALTCIVVEQTKYGKEYLTTCKGVDLDGKVVFDTKIAVGQAAKYQPFIGNSDEFIHGKIMEVGDAPPETPKPEVVSDTGKAP